RPEPQIQALPAECLLPATGFDKSLPRRHAGWWPSCWPCTASSRMRWQGRSYRPRGCIQWVAIAQEILRIAENLEGILQTVALGRRDILGFNIVVRFAALLDVQCLMPYACKAEELECVP